VKIVIKIEPNDDRTVVERVLGSIYGSLQDESHRQEYEIDSYIRDENGNRVPYHVTIKDNPFFEKQEGSEESLWPVARRRQQSLRYSW